MITLNRLGHHDEPFQLNIDMIVTVEATPDTVITLATGAKVVVAETPGEVASAVHSYRAAVLAEAFRRRGRVSGHASEGPPAPAHRDPAPAHRDSPREAPHLSAVEDDPT
jgi:flagellar protein FlbD